jgi:hypothetical protein
VLVFLLPAFSGQAHSIQNEPVQTLVQLSTCKFVQHFVLHALFF